MNTLGRMVRFCIKFVCSCNKFSLYCMTCTRCCGKVLTCAMVIKTIYNNIYLVLTFDYNKVWQNNMANTTYFFQLIKSKREFKSFFTYSIFPVRLISLFFADSPVLMHIFSYVFLVNFVWHYFSLVTKNPPTFKTHFRRSKLTFCRC